MMPNESFAISLVLFLAAPILACAQVTSHGNGNANVGTNNGQIIINNTFRTTKPVERRLRELTKSGDGSTNGWMAKLYPGSERADLGSCKQLLAQSSPRMLLPPGAEAELKNAFVINFGGSTFLCAHLPCKVFALDDEVIVSLVPNGKALGVSARVRGDGGKMVASIDGEIAHINQHIAWYFERPDIHTLTVVDQDGDESLSVSYEGPRFVKLRGRFTNRSGDSHIVATDDSLVFTPDTRHQTFYNQCFMDYGLSVHSDGTTETF